MSLWRTRLYEIGILLVFLYLFLCNISLIIYLIKPDKIIISSTMVIAGVFLGIITN